MRVISLDELRSVAKAAKGSIYHIYLHWTAGHYGSAYNSYHICIDDDGSIYLMTEDLCELKAHTYRRNTGAIGISLCCCADASANDGYDTDFGPEPPTSEQIETLAKVVAALSQELNVSIDIMHVMTHAEAANNEDGNSNLHEPYGPYSGDPETRWDLWYLPDSAENGKMVIGGDVIRGKALWYASQG